MDVRAISVRFPEDLYERLRKTAFDRRESMNSLVVEGTELRLTQLGPHAETIREALRLAAQEAPDDRAAARFEEALKAMEEEQ